jgi:hypothetical protein
MIKFWSRDILIFVFQNLIPGGVGVRVPKTLHKSECLWTRILSYLDARYGFA